MPVNRLITRGMGTSRGVAGRAGMVTQGYGGFFKKIVEAGERFIKAGQSGAKRALRELEEIVVWAKLVRVNDEKPKTQVQGQVTVKIDLSRRIAVLAEGFTHRVRSVFDDIKIIIKRIR